MTDLPSEETRRQIETIAVVSLGSEIDREYFATLPRSIHPESVTEGAGYGAAAVLEAFARGGCVGEGCGAAFLIGLAIFIPLGALIGGTADALDDAREQTARDIEAHMAEAFSAPVIQRKIQERVVQSARAQTGYRIIVPTRRPEDPTETSGDPSLESVDAVLEISPKAVGLAGEAGTDPPVGLFMNVRARLVGVRDHRELYAHTVSYYGAPRLYSEWKNEDGQRLEAELERAYRSLAETIVDEVFLLWRPSS